MDNYEISKKEAADLVNDYIKLGLNLEIAKKCAIKSLRQEINTLDTVDGLFFVGLKPMIEKRRAMIFFIIEM